MYNNPFSILIDIIYRNFMLSTEYEISDDELRSSIEDAFSNFKSFE
jgi:hypothetical protein